MSISGRKRVSKWDLQEEPQLFLGGTQHGTGLRKAKVSAHNKESQSGSTDSEGYGFKSNHRDDREFSDDMLAWDGEGRYSTRMSPGLEDWRQRNRSRSPIIGQARSDRSRKRNQSRSPPYGSKRESGLDRRSNAAQTCRDFVSGRCRRGDHCPYLHQSDRGYEDRQHPEDSLTKGWKSRHMVGGDSKYSTSDDRREYLQIMGRSSSKYVHNGAPPDKESSKEVFREKENERSRYAVFEHGREHELQRSGDIPCKFFAAGNCRGGKYCRFSHHGRTDSPNDRSRDDWRRQSGDLDTLEQSGDHLNRSAATVTDNAKMLEWNECRNGNAGAHEHREAAYSRDDRLVARSFNVEKRSSGHPTNNDETVDPNKREYLQPKAETTAVTVGFESKGAESWFADMDISSPWSSGHIGNEESGHISETLQSLPLNITSLQTYEQNITGEMLGQEPQDTAATPPMISENARLPSKPRSREDAGSSYSHALEVRKAASDWPMSSVDQKISANVLPGQSLDPNAHSSSAVTHPLTSFNEVGQNQQTFPLYTPREKSTTTAQNLPLFQEDKSFHKPNVVDGNRSVLTSEIPPIQNIVTREQLSQFTNLSALSQLFGNVQQFCHLAAVSNPPKSMEFVSSSLSNSSGPVNPLAAAFIHPNQVSSFERQYDPLSDSIESVKRHNDSPLPGLLPNPVEGKVVPAKNPVVLSGDVLTTCTGGPSGNDQYTMGHSEVELDQACLRLDQPNPVANCDGEGNNVTTAEESHKSQENKPLEKTNEDGWADEGKKKNDGKGIRAFKFALAEFVKEILKPKWKDHQISKESHKAIVKKVVDKVTGSIQGAHIPQSQGKIDNYLSSSKPKLTKLVEAYVEKYQKSEEL
ncbi:Zinc finger CCCH domain-containing protein [Actinidia chinensis var. chinensis]|uniref:Zinc finger CCCH domain-containing protein n=1 Tax=Actinidia chinensis var. chinensis TaxID=1590841 RepID=A0A2R6RDK9_ACTCC|nr:Zinc finger CCCH domain-containing protein [Actinidia chinensis var. chinensis]